jgi:hypothetical protein
VSQPRVTTLDLLGGLNAITTSPLKQLDIPSHDSRFSSESDAVKSEQSEDEGNDESRSTGFEEWYGFQDTTFDGASPDEVLHPILPSSSFPLSVQSSPGTTKTALQRHRG